MGSTGAVRPARTRRAATVVAVTGAAGAVGERIVRALADSPEVRTVVGVDARRGVGEGITWRVADVASPAVAQKLSGADVVVHLACPADLDAALAVDPVTRRLRTLREAQAVLTSCAAVGVRHVVVVTSAMVFGALADAPIPLAEDGPLQAPPDDGLVGDLLEVERVLERARGSHPQLTLSVLRPAALVGPGVDTMVTRHFEAPRLLSVRESPMVWQFCHVDDLAAAVVTTVTARLEGALTVASEGVLTEQSVERISGMRRMDLPAGVAFGTAERLHRLGVLPMPASDLAYVVYPWVVPVTRLRAAGWTPVHDNETCLGVLLAEVAGRRAVAGRRVDRRDAALGAAGAAVALVGTAAVWRQARVRQTRRRGGLG